MWMIRLPLPPWKIESILYIILCEFADVITAISIYSVVMARNYTCDGYCTALRIQRPHCIELVETNSRLARKSNMKREEKGSPFMFEGKVSMSPILPGLPTMLLIWKEGHNTSFFMCIITIALSFSI